MSSNTYVEETICQCYDAERNAYQGRDGRWHCELCDELMPIRGIDTANVRSNALSLWFGQQTAGGEATASTKFYPCSTSDDWGSCAGCECYGVLAEQIDGEWFCEDCAFKRVLALRADATAAKMSSMEPGDWLLIRRHADGSYVITEGHV